MKKVFLPVLDCHVDEDEAAHIERYWTGVWDGVDLKGCASANIKRRDEFKAVRKHIASLPREAHILDGGCGVGDWTMFFAHLGYDIVGLDLSSKVIGRLIEIFPEQKRRFIHGDLRKTQFSDSEFDAYFSWGVFEHFEGGPGECFREAARILKKGAYLFVSVPYYNYRQKLKDWLAGAEGLEQKEKRFYQYKLAKKELRSGFEKYGFRVIEVKAIHKLFGMHRLVKNDLHLKSGSLIYKIAKYSLYPFFPKSYVAHMIIGVGIKR